MVPGQPRSHGQYARGRRTPQQTVWTFSSLGDHRVSWWRRRLAVGETAIHRWDAQHAVAVEGGPPPTPLGADVAAAGIEEFVTEFLPGLLDSCTDSPSGKLHLLLTDAAPKRWLRYSMSSAATSPSTRKLMRPFAGRRCPTSCYG